MKTFSKLMSKRLISLALLIALLSTSALAVHPTHPTEPQAPTKSTYEVDGGTVEFDTNSGKITQASFTGTTADIPAQLGGADVKYIGMKAFSFNKTLKSVTLPEGLREIHISAFYNCPSISTLNLPESLEEIGNTAFGLCNSLTDVVIPSNVKTIGNMAFYGSTGIKSVTIPAGVESIGSKVFWQCRDMTDVYFEGTEEQWYAIDIDDDNTQLFSATLHFADGETSMHTAPEGQTGWTNVEGIEGGRVFFNASTGTIEQADDTITVADIPEQIGGVTVKAISNKAFSYSKNLTSVTVPGTVEKITLGTFAHANKLQTLVVEEGVKSIGVSAFYNCKNLESVSLPTTLEFIDNTAFGMCTSLLHVAIPEGVKDIGNMAFYASALQSADLPATLENVGYKVFWQCHKLTDLYFSGTSEQWYGIEIDDNNTALFSTTLHYGDGDSGQHIAPEGKTGWMNVEGIEGGRVFFNVSTGTIEQADPTVTVANIPEQIGGVTVKDIHYSAFSRNENLVSVFIPGTVEKIGLGAFSHCKNLRDVFVAEGVKKIGISAFYNCKNLEIVTLPSSLERIDNTAFGLCTSLTDFVVPEGVTSLGNMVFYGSTSLQSITLPAGLTEMGMKTFWQCHKFETVYFEGGADQWTSIDIAHYNDDLFEAQLLLAE